MNPEPVEEKTSVADAIDAKEDTKGSFFIFLEKLKKFWEKTGILPARQGTVLGLVLGMGFCIWVMAFFGTVLVHQTNLDRTSSDQQYNIDLARESSNDWYPYRSKGIVKPLWPWVASLVVVEDDQESFIRGKILNLLLSGGFVVGVMWWSSRILPLWGVLNLGLVMGLGALIPRGAWFQPEPLFYMAFAWAWWIGWKTLKTFRWRDFIFLGIALGVGYLAKSSTNLLLGVFFAGGILRWGWSWIERKWTGESSWKGLHYFAGLGLALGIFGVLILPGAVYSQKKYGDPFHSWPKYWMWQDDFGSESVPFMAQYNSREKLEAMTDEEKPSMKNYFKTHSGEEAWERLSVGVSHKVWRFFVPEGKIKKPGKGKPWKQILFVRGGYLLAFLGIWVLVTGVSWTQKGRFRMYAGTDLLQFAFVGMAFVGYSLAYGWYHPIGAGERFLLSLYAPMVLSFAVGAGICLRERWTTSHWIQHVFGACHALLFLCLLCRIWEVM